MRNRKLSRFSTFAVAAGLVFTSFQASPEDIDIFSVDENGIVARPNIIIVLDNSANWSRQSQNWPGNETQGESEAGAIIEVLNAEIENDPLDPNDNEDLVDDTVNLGLMEHLTGGTSVEQDSGYIRAHVRPMSTANKDALIAKLETIRANINDPNEKRNQGNPFGKLMWDVYNYLAGVDHSNRGSGTLSGYADLDAYTDDVNFDTFQSPLTSADTCTRTIVIFIGNNTASGPSVDSGDGDNVGEGGTAVDPYEMVDTETALFRVASAGLMGDAATAAGNDAILQQDMAEYLVEQRTQTDALGLSEACYASVSACTSEIQSRDVNNNGTRDCQEQGFLSCECRAADAAPCATSNTWSVIGENNQPVASVTYGPQDQTDEPDTDTGDAIQLCKTDNQGSGLNTNPVPSCPATTTTFDNDTDPDTGVRTETKTVTSWVGSCTYRNIGSDLNSDGVYDCQGANKNHFQKQGTRRRNITITEYTPTIVPTPLGTSASCYATAADCTADTGDLNCNTDTYSEGCRCTTTVGTCVTGSNFKQFAEKTFIASEETGRFRTSPGKYLMDEWARFLLLSGVPVPGAGGARTPVTTYTIDVFNEQQNPDFTALLFNAARLGGGKYFQAKNKDSIVDALKQILTEVQAVNSAFSSASLPVNATNRAQNQNQVFIGVFKPNKDKRPGWFGNLKQYQLIMTGTTVELGDKNGDPAINEQTGFITECAVSFWTTDSIFPAGTPRANHAYWEYPNTASPPPRGDCADASNSLNDLPDGPFVEKGAVAQVLREGNDPSASPDAAGNYLLNRSVLTRTAAVAAGQAPVALSAANTGTLPSSSAVSDTVVKYIRGEDIKNDDTDSNSVTCPTSGLCRAYTEPRSNIHGDVVHSRPQPLNYGGTTGVVVYYGANDGTYRAVRASTGQELWAFVAPEHHHKLNRLHSNSPNIRYFGDVIDPTVLETPTPKDYFFDGSTGVYQTFDGSGNSVTAYVYPSMRRGGAKVYGFDVSSPLSSTPVKYLWSKGCTVDATGTYTNCDTGFEAIGQTWSLPNVAFVKGYCGASACSTTNTVRKPVVVFGGGYDIADDDNSATPPTAVRGRGVYIVDATDGTLLKYIDFSGLAVSRGIAADVALIDIDNDSFVDYGYAVDTGGNVYRFDFVDYTTGTADSPGVRCVPPSPQTDPVTCDSVKDPLTKTQWFGSRVAYTNDVSDPRKFLFAPALVQANTSTVYVAVGSGDREHPLRSHYPYGSELVADSAILNRFYVWKDPLTDTDSATALNLDSSTEMADYTNNNSCDAATITPSNPLRGWFVDLDDEGRGEQVVTSAVIAAGFVFFSTNRPTQADPNASVCTTSLGEARGYFLNLLNGSGAIGVDGACGGSRSSVFVGGGLPPSPVLATVPIGPDCATNGPDCELRTVVIGAVQKTGEPSSPIEAQRVRPPIPSYRKPIYWYKSTGDK